MTNLIDKNLQKYRARPTPPTDWTDLIAGVVLVIVALVVIGLMLVMGFAPEVLL